MTTGTELETVADLPEYLTRPPIYHQMDAQQLAVIKSTVAKGADDTELAMFLELAASLDLNPFAHEIWCAKSRARDGKPGHILIMIGRDGLLKNANRYGDYRGYDADVVHENDDFRKVDPSANSATLRGRAGVVHTYGHPKERGPVIGAWCAAERDGRPPRFFYAALEEYMPKGENDKSAWAKHPSVMIDKVALSVAHRTLCNITGVLIEEEAARMFDADTDAVEVTVDEAELFGDDPAVADRLRSAVAAANAIEPNTFTPATLQLLLGGRTAAELEDVADDLERRNAERAGSEPTKEPGAEASPDPTSPEGSGPVPDEAVLIRTRLVELHDARAQMDDPTTDEAVVTDAEIEELEARLREIAGAAPGQTDLGV